MINCITILRPYNWAVILRCDSNIGKYIVLNIELSARFLISNNKALALFGFADRESVWGIHVRFRLVLTPKYLTLSIGKSLLRLNFHFTSPSNCLLLDLKVH